MIKSHDVSEEARIPKGQPHAGQWTDTPHPTNPEWKRTTPQQRERAEALLGKLVPATTWDMRFPEGKRYRVTWRDAKGRLQMGYDAQHSKQAAMKKFEALLQVERALPKLRAKVRRDLDAPGTPKNRALAAATRMIDTSCMRVGGVEYAEQNATYGAATLLKLHLTTKGNTLYIAFNGKHSKEWNLTMNDSKLVKALRAMSELPGDDLMRYTRQDGTVATITDADIRGYTYEFGITPKQFRTYHATGMAFNELQKIGPAPTEKAARKNISAVVKAVSQRLGNTPQVCKAQYINPAILQDYLLSAIANEERAAEPMHKSAIKYKRRFYGLTPTEQAFARYLRAIAPRVRSGELAHYNDDES